MFGVFAEGGEQPGVISGAVVVNVVGADGDASEALEEIVLFIRSAIRTDEADRVGAVKFANGF